MLIRVRGAKVGGRPARPPALSALWHSRSAAELMPSALAVLAAASTALSLLPSESDGGSVPPLRSRRAQALAGADFTFSVDAGGGASIVTQGATFQLASSFSSPGRDEPVWHNLSKDAAHSGWSVAVDRSGAGRGEWVVRAVPAVVGAAANFTVKRRYHLDPAPPARPIRVLINDSLTSLADEIIGVHVQHHARLTAGGTVESVQVPGRFEAGMCGTDGPNGNAAIFGSEDYEAHSTNFGAPHIWLNTTVGAGLGLVALDDVFRVHSQQRQFALASLNPRVQMVRKRLFGRFALETENLPRQARDKHREITQKPRF
jgi:hypothetical protein